MKYVSIYIYIYIDGIAYAKREKYRVGRRLARYNERKRKCWKRADEPT